MDNYINYDMDDIMLKTYMIPATDNTYTNQNFNNTFIGADEGFLRGNLQMGTYIPYKNMTFIKPVINDERNQKLYEIQKNGFAAHDVNLYLDTHPQDTNAIKLYNDYLRKEKELTDEFEKKYGPINLSDSDSLGMTPWAWINEPWPWNK